MITNDLVLNANNKNVKTLIHAVQGENGSRIFEFTVIGTDGEILNLSDCEANFYVSKNDGTVSMLPTVISENSVQVTLTQQACAVSGDNDCWLQIIKANETAELRVDNLVLRVQKCNFDGAVESSDEFVTLTQKIVEANEAIKNANQASDDVRQDGAQAIQEINQNFNTAMTGFNQEIDAAVKKAEDAAGKSEEIAEQAAISTISTQKNQANGIAGLDGSGKLIQMPTAADVGAVPTSRTINGKALTGNITLTAQDVSAIASSERNQANGVAGLNASGKVMQMPAAIADYVVEQGKNGTWTYRKWESGVAECWGAYTVSLESMDTGISGVSGRSGKITLPSGLFSGKPTAASVAVDWYYAEWETISISSASELSFRLYGNNNSGTIGSIGCNPYVIGRWK